MTASQPTLDGERVALNGIELYFRTCGDGPVLLLLHGFFHTGDLWSPFVSALAKEYRLLIPDLRGHGRSTNPSERFTHRQAARDMYALLDRLGIERCYAIGDSTGGMTLLHMATQQPQRVEAMVLVGATTYYPQEARALIAQTTFEGYSPEQLEILRARHVGGDAQIRALVKQFRGFEHSYEDMNFTPPHLATIKARTLIIHGDRDQYFPIDIPLQMYRAIPRSYLWILPNRTHAVMVEAFGATEEGRELFVRTATAFLRGEWEGA